MKSKSSALRPKLGAKRLRLVEGLFMRLVQLTFAAIVVGALFLAVASTRGGVKAQASAQVGDAAASCEATVEGWIHPADVPSYLQWHPLLAALASSDTTIVRRLNVVAATAERMKGQAAAGVALANELKASRGDAAMAGAILDARDELIRLLPKATFEDLQAIVADRTAAASFTIPVVGKRVHEGTVSRCRVEVNFTKQPHLVPEVALWDAYLASLADVARLNRLADGSFPEAYLSGWQITLKIQPASATYLLNLSSSAATQIEALRANGSSERDIAAAVMGFRTELLRTMPRKDWNAVKRHASQTAGKYYFPPSW